MLEFDTPQKVAEIGTPKHRVKLGGQPGENPPVMIGTVFYSAHKALLDEKTGEVDKDLLERELNEFASVVDETGMQGIVDVVGSNPDALLKECQLVADMVDFPFLVDGLNDEIRIPAIKGLKEIGLIDRAILNSIDSNTSEENLELIKNIGVKNAVLLTFGSKYIYPEQKMEFLKETLIPKAERAGIENIIVDTAVLDLPSIGINVKTVELVKKQLGLPSGFAPANAIFGWNFTKRKNYGDAPRCGGIASVMTYCLDAGSDFVLFGPVKFSKCVIPGLALVSGINSYFRKRILREDISELTPLKKIF